MTYTHTQRAHAYMYILAFEDVVRANLYVCRCINTVRVIILFWNEPWMVRPYLPTMYTHTRTQQTEMYFYTFANRIQIDHDTWTYTYRRMLQPKNIKSPYSTIFTWPYNMHMCMCTHAETNICTGKKKQNVPIRTILETRFEKQKHIHKDKKAKIKIKKPCMRSHDTGLEFLVIYNDETPICLWNGAYTYAYVRNHTAWNYQVYRRICFYVHVHTHTNGSGEALAQYIYIYLHVCQNFIWMNVCINS